MHSPRLSLLLVLLSPLATSFLLAPPPPQTTAQTTALGARPEYRKLPKTIDEVFEGNEKYVESQLAKDPEFFNRLGSEHQPKYMWIGCSDARVVANQIMGVEAGSVFTVRNVANLVCGTDFNTMSALQYAVGVLEVPHIVVCGHYDCGGVRASIQNKDHVPPLENWLRNIRDVYRLHRVELNAIPDAENRHRRLVELNVIEQCINLFKTGVVQRKRVETYASKEYEVTQPHIHACVFDPKTGRLNPLKVDFKKYIDELHNIYDLYSVEEFQNKQDAKMSRKIGVSNPQAPDKDLNTI